LTWPARGGEVGRDRPKNYRPRAGWSWSQKDRGLLEKINPVSGISRRHRGRFVQGNLSFFSGREQMGTEVFEFNNVIFVYVINT
jgi:hypothetical protein